MGRGADTTITRAINWYFRYRISATEVQSTAWNRYGTTRGQYRHRSRRSHRATHARKICSDAAVLSQHRERVPDQREVRLGHAKEVAQLRVEEELQRDEQHAKEQSRAEALQHEGRL